MLKQRRLIAKWTEQAVASKIYDCTQCDTPIQSHSLYNREVMATPKTIEVERIHLSPPCPDFYYTGH